MFVLCTCLGLCDLVSVLCHSCSLNWGFVVARLRCFTFTLIGVLLMGFRDCFLVFNLDVA